MARHRRPRARAPVPSADAVARGVVASSGAPPRRGGRSLDDAVAVAVILVASALLNYGHDRITDPDSFYHWRHAWVYMTSGLGETAFPWTQFSVIRTLGADLWYGLHVLMIPLTWTSDPVAAIKLGSFLSTAAALALFYAAQRRAGTAWPLLGTLVFLFATADLMYRITMLRPHPLSLGLTLLVFAEATVDPPGRDRGRLLRLACYAALVAWLHLAVAWMPLLVMAVAAGVRVVRRSALDPAGAVAVAAGVLAGWVLRPHAWQAARLAFIQVAYLSLQHQREVPLRFGHELRPLHVSELHKQLLGLMLLLAVGLGVVVVMRVRRLELGTRLWCSLVIWPLFFVLAFMVFRRANEVMVAFAVTFLGLVAARARQAAGAQGLVRLTLGSWPATLATAIIAVALVLMPAKTMKRMALFLPNAFDPDRFRAASAWLAENSAPGEIVFNADWDRFGMLFFWNPRNHYIHGMDPIFMYAYDPSLYWKSHFLSVDAVTSFTCGQVKCNSVVGEDTRTVLRRDFRASYILVERGRNPSLLAYLLGAPGFTKVFEGDYEVLFRIS
jgi:hypothetical protein